MHEPSDLKAPATGRPSRARRWRILLAAFVAAACGPAKPPNVLIVVVDTLRADRVGWYGGSRGLTPFLDSLAARGTVFWQAYAQSSWTSPSVASLLTSRYQAQHGVTVFESVLGPEEVCLPEVLQAHGWTTGAFVANSILESRFGWGQGFDTWAIVTGDVPLQPSLMWMDPRSKPRARHVNQAALAWLDAVRRERPARPVLLYLHYMEPHTPYAPSTEAVDRVLRRHPDPERAREMIASLYRGIDPARWSRPDPASLAAIEDLYDSEVSDLDTSLRALFASLEERGFLRDAVVVVTADHGEEFREHGGMSHGSSLYEEIIRVPLLISSASDARSRAVREPVGLVDVAPTVLQLAGLAAPDSFEGRSLVHTAAPVGEMVAYSEQADKPAWFAPPHRHDRAVITGTRKLIVTSGGGTETYDLARDPAERRRDLVAPSERHVLTLALTRARERALRNHSTARRATMDAETRARLRALGYAQ